MKRFKTVCTLLLVLALFASLTVLASAETGVRWNISYSHVSCNGDAGGLPAAVRTLNPGETVSANFQVTTAYSLRFKEATFYLRGPGQSGYTAVGKDTAQNYFRYCWLDVKIPASFQSGKADYYWLVKYTSGRVEKYYGSITISGNTTMGKINAFLNDSRWKDGSSWGYYQKPKISSYSGIGCCAYTADYVKYCYGKDSPRSGVQYNSASGIRAGDVVVTTPQHWLVVLTRTGNTIRVAEGNWDSRVHIGTYTISGNQLLRTNGSVYKTFAVGYHYC